MSPQPPSIGDSDLESELRNLSSGPSSLPLGHSTVKSLSHKFQQNGNGNGHSPQNGQNGYVLFIYLAILLTENFDWKTFLGKHREFF